MNLPNRYDDATREWAEFFPACWVCGRRDTLSTHHIIAGRAANVVNDPAQFVRLCQRDHDIFQSTNLDNIRTLLVLKKHYDPEHLSIRRVILAWRPKASLGFIAEVANDVRQQYKRMFED